jgi:hypothetical protein
MNPEPRPGLRRGGQDKLLELILATSQGRLIGLKLTESLTANFRRVLSGPVAVLVEVDQVVRHGIMSFCWLPAHIRPYQENRVAVLTRAIQERAFLIIPRGVGPRLCGARSAAHSRSTERPSISLRRSQDS